jgi:hypothetical protein
MKSSMVSMYKALHPLPGTPPFPQSAQPRFGHSCVPVCLEPDLEIQS